MTNVPHFSKLHMMTWLRDSQHKKPDDATWFEIIAFSSQCHQTDLVSMFGIELETPTVSYWERTGRKIGRKFKDIDTGKVFIVDLVTYGRVDNMRQHNYKEFTWQRKVNLNQISF